MKALFAGIGLLLSAFTPAMADVVTRCTDPKGYTYFYAGGAIPQNQSGWTEDKITGGSYLILREGAEFDIVFTDATKRTISTKQDGGKVVAISREPLVLLAVYAGNVEIWTLNIDGHGLGTLSIHQSRFGAYPVRKESLMRADCRR